MNGDGYLFFPTEHRLVPFIQPGGISPELDRACRKKQLLARAFRNAARHRLRQPYTAQ